MQAVDIKLEHGSLTSGQSSVLVNGSNTNALLGSGVSGAIRAACGKGFQGVVSAALEQRFGRSMPPGSVLLTTAGAHPVAKWVAHVAVMDYRDGGFSARSMPTQETIRLGCQNLWAELEKLGEPVTVAMVALGAGTGNLGVVEPTRIECETLKAHLIDTPATKLRQVTFYGFHLHEFLAMAEVVVSFFPEVARSLPAEAREVLTSRSRPM